MVYTAEGMCQIAVQEYTADYKDGFLTTMVCFYTLVTVRFIFCWGFVYIVWERVIERLSFSKIFKTEIQYLPVESMQTSVQRNFVRLSDSSCNPFVKEKKWVSLYLVWLLEVD